MEDFSAWLRQAATEGDDVVVTMDLGAGREFALLSRMVRDGTVALVDKLYIRWHYQISVRRLLRVGARSLSKRCSVHCRRTPLSCAHGGQLWIAV